MSKPLIFALSALFLCGGLTAQELLAYSLREGDVYTVEQRAEQTVFQQLAEGEHQLTNRVTAVLEFQVRDVRDSTFVLEMRFRDLFIRILSSSEGQVLNIRARELDPGDLRSRMFYSLIDFPVLLEITRQGEVINVAGGDGLVRRMMSGAGPEPGLDRSALQEKLMNDYSSEALAASFEQLTFIYPDRKVRSGEHWTNRSDGYPQAVATWTLDTLAEGSASISGKAAIRLPDPSGSTQPALTGKQTMQVQTEAGNGFVRKMSVSGEATGTSPGEFPGAVPVETRVITQSTFTLIDHKHVQ